MHRFRRDAIAGLLGLLAVVLACSARGAVKISEFLASNATGLRDADRHAEDWIELHNSGVDAVSLEGWFLTDTKSNPTKWRFPDYILGAGEYAVIFASGKDRTNPATALHTNFKLDAGGEYLALIRADGHTVESDFAPEYPRQFTDLSYGRALTEAGEAVGYFATPTPGVANGVVTGPPAVAPILSRAGGTFVDAFDVIVAATPETAVVHYTLDGSIPTTDSPVYATPIRIEGTRLLRARAFVPGLAPSPVVGAAYTRLGTSVRSVSSDLPLVVVNLFSRTMTETTKNPVYLAVREPDPVTGFANLTREPQIESRAGMEIRGASSAGFEKKSYGVEIQNEAGLDRAESLLGMPADSDWVLYAPYTDKSLIRDVLAYELSRRIGRYAPRTRFVELYVNRGNTDLDSGDYLGVYVLIEKLKIASERVAVAGMEPDDLAMPAISGGYLLKRDRFDSNDQVLVTGRGVELGIEDPKRSQIGTTQRTWIRTWLGEMERAMYGADWRDSERGYRRYLNEGSFIDHQLLVESAKNIDGYRLSTFWHKDREGLLNMGPIWDYNLTFGNADYLSGWRTNGWYWQEVSDPGYTWLRRLFQDSDFRQAYIDRWFEIRSGPFSARELTALIDQLADQVRRAQARNFARWRILGQYVWPNWYIAPTWQAEINWMKGWTTNRAAWMDSQFIAPPAASDPGGAMTQEVTLSLQARRGTLYYSLDGADPRQPGGALSAAATEYSAPLKLRENARVFARSRSGTNWSAPYLGTFVFRRPALAMVEVMYQPVAVEGLEREFIEVRNVGAVDERLAGVRISGAVEFRFPADAGVLLPGERVVVVGRNDAWAGATFRRAGEFKGDLPDAGGTLVLSGPVGEPIQTLAYSRRWYGSTAGGGYSLTVVDDTLTGDAFSDSTNWRASVVPGGTPGRGNVFDRGAPQVTVVRSEAGRLEFRWRGTAGMAYVLQSCTNLLEARWSVVGKVVAPGGVGETKVSEAFAPSEVGRFYRVVSAVD